MVDTVCFNAPHEVRRRYLGRSPRLPNGWQLEAFRKSKALDTDEEECAERETRVFKHLASGLRAIGSEIEIRKIEVSLPRLLHGGNGMLIKDGSELDDALCRTLQIVREMAIPTTMEKFDFARLDLVWQFRGNPADFFKAHWHLRHKRVRKETGHWDGQSLYWPGCGFRVRMYDKELEQNGTHGQVVRVEVQLRGKRLRELFDFAYGG